MINTSEFGRTLRLASKAPTKMLTAWQASRGDTANMAIIARQFTWRLWAGRCLLPSGFFIAMPLMYWLARHYGQWFVGCVVGATFVYLGLYLAFKVSPMGWSTIIQAFERDLGGKELALLPLIDMDVDFDALASASRTTLVTRAQTVQMWEEVYDGRRFNKKFTGEDVAKAWLGLQAAQLDLKNGLQLAKKFGFIEDDDAKTFHEDAAVLRRIAKAQEGRSL